jgi:glycosyltransferase involved in cell wall biosynthesis
MKISVIIPAYNAEQYIGKAIESCLSQTHAPYEIIVVDDASTDGTSAVAESFFPSVRVIRLAENMGVSVARNKGVQASTGDWVAFLDADDWFLPEKLELQQRCADENKDAVLIYSGFRILPVCGKESSGWFVPPAKLWPMLRYRCPIHLSSVILRRDAFDCVGGFDPLLRVNQDWELWLKLAARYSVKLFAAAPEQLVMYRRVAGSLSSNALRYFKAHSSLLESRCLCGTSGLSKCLWRQRIKAFFLYDTSLALREEGSPKDLFFILKSIALFPFIVRGMPMKRYIVAAVMLKQHVFGR